MAELNVNDTNELIEVKNNNGELLVSARDLHRGLILDEGKEERFSQWFKRYLKYGFEENIDYVGCKKIYTANQYGGEQELQDYALKIDMAKEICMLQRSDKGRAYRKYFLECEKRLKENQTPQLSDRDNAILSVMNAVSDIERVSALKQFEDVITKPLLTKIEEDKPLVDFSNTIAQNTDSIDMGTFAKLIKEEGIKMGRNKLFDWLRENKYLMKNNIPYQKFIDNKYFEIIEYSYNTPYGSKLGTKTLITGLGQIKIVEKLRKEFIKKGE